MIDQRLKETSDSLTKVLAKVNAMPVKDLTIEPTSFERQNHSLRALVLVIESALQIVHRHHYSDPDEPEPFPGACQSVIEQNLATIALARKLRLVA